MPSKQGDYNAVRASIAKVLNQPNYDGYDESVKHSAGPVLVRLAWHASGTYDVKTDTGGSDGAGMRYEAEGGDPANAGQCIRNVARLVLSRMSRLAARPCLP